MKEKKNSQKEKKKDDKKKCFIIMPITTPKSLISKYSGGENHFAHVLDQIFIPAIEKSNLDPIPPKAAGSGLIQADIIKNLETADLVLCDMSTLNPNVFFEFGIRTALNKPVSLVVDDKTPDIPFDSSMIHHHEYKSALQNWTHKEDISSLSDHINESLKKSKKENSLWKYFGLSSFAHSVELKEGEQARWSYLIKQIESLKEKIEGPRRQLRFNSKYSGKPVWEDIFDLAMKMGLSPKKISTNIQENILILEIKDEINPFKLNILSKMAERDGWRLVIGKWGDLDGPL